MSFPTSLLLLLGLLSLGNSYPLLAHYRHAAPAGPQALDLAEEWLGRDFDIGKEFGPNENWPNVEGADWQLGPWKKWINDKPGRRFLYSVRTWPDGIGANLEDCANGTYNAHYKKLADNLVAYGLQKTILRFGWEWSGDWFPWGVKANGGNKYTQYAGCFRQFVISVRSAQPNAGFEFDWNANGDFHWDSKWQLAYPGDEYVDYTGIDSYDQSWMAGTYPFPSGCDINCQNQRRLLAWNNDQVKGFNAMRDFAKAHGKKFSLPEWGVWVDSPSAGGDSALFIQKVYEWIMDPNNLVGYASYFDTTTDCDHVLSNVNVYQSNGKWVIDKSYKTVNPMASAKYIELFSKMPRNEPQTSNSTSTAASTETSTYVSTSVSTSTSESVSVSTPTTDNGTNLQGGNQSPTLTISFFLLSILIFVSFC